MKINKNIKENMLVEILPHIWITSFNASYISSFINKKTPIIINTSKINKYVDKMDKCETQIREYNMPLNKTSHINELNRLLKSYLVEVIPLIHENINNNKTILIVGNNNGQDAEAIVAAYLIKYAKVNVNIAEEFIKSKRKHAFTPYNIYNLTLSTI